MMLCAYQKKDALVAANLLGEELYLLVRQSAITGHNLYPACLFVVVNSLTVEGLTQGYVDMDGTWCYSGTLCKAFIQDTVDIPFIVRMTARKWESALKAYEITENARLYNGLTISLVNPLLRSVGSYDN